MAQALQGYFWDKLFPVLFTGFLVIVGWGITYRLSRRNQLRSFKEGVLDKVRTELNKPLIEYREWLGKTRSEVKHLSLGDIPKGEGYKPWRTQLFERLVANSKSWVWYQRLGEYTFLFPGYKKVIADMEHRQNVIIR